MIDRIKETIMRPLFFKASSVILTLSSLVVSSCYREPNSQRSGNATLRLKWIHQAQFAGFYVAARKHFYQDAGLNVTINPGGVDFPAIQMVVGGDEQFGVTGADQILLAREKGMPVVAIAVIYKTTPMVLFSLKQKNITKPSDLIGRNVGVKIGGNEEMTYRALIRRAGISAALIHEIPAKYDMSPLFAGTVDVWPGYDINEPIVAEEQGHRVNLIEPSKYGVNLYADTLFTTEVLIKNRPDLVRKFVTQSVRGWQFAVDHVDEAVSATLSFDDKLVRSHETAMMRASIPHIRPDESPIGLMDLASWSSVNRILLESGQLHTPAKIENAFTNDFLHE